MKKKACYIILCDPWEICFEKLRRIEEEFELNKILIGNRIKELVDSNSPLGINLKSYIDTGRIIPKEITYRLWEDELKTTMFDKIYFFNLPEDEKETNFLLKLAVENHFEIKYGWYIKKLNLDLTEKEEQVLKSIKKTKGNKGVDIFWKNKEYWKRRNGIALNILKTQIQIRMIEV